MRKLACAVCIGVLTLVFVQWEVAGQRRVGPKPTQPVPPSSTAPTSVSTESPRKASEQAAYKPAIEYQYLMELRFYENQWRFPGRRLGGGLSAPRSQESDICHLPIEWRSGKYSPVAPGNAACKLHRVRDVPAGRRFGIGAHWGRLVIMYCRCISTASQSQACRSL